MAVATYLRVSTDEQRERQSINTQRDFAERYCGLHNRSHSGIDHEQNVHGDSRVRQTNEKWTAPDSPPSAVNRHREGLEESPGDPESQHALQRTRREEQVSAARTHQVRAVRIDVRRRRRKQDWDQG